VTLTIPALAADEARRAFATMWLIRAFEEAVRTLHGKGRLPGFMHVSVGQEAVPTGVSLALRPTDLTTSPHRNHGHVIAKGAPVDGMFAEMFGRAAGLCRGKGGSLHIAHAATGSMGANGIVAAGMPIALGLALGHARQGRDTVVVAYAGDGAIANGTSHEALNLAALWRVPIVFVREDNQYAESTPHSHYQAMPDVLAYVETYGIEGRAIDGNDVEAVAEAARWAVDHARSGRGPAFLQCATYRWYGHNIGDTGAYRPADEVEAWRARDPIVILQRRLLDRGDATEADIEAIKAAAQERIDTAIAAAEASADPPERWAYDDVFTSPALRRLTGPDRP
jgi:acetoin:2,6-dichlorophenolindophenol oxidoreductase subunit alpha